MTNISGRTFNTQSMSGRKYVYEFPDLLQAVADSSTFEAGLSDDLSLPGKLYLQHGELELQAAPNKRFYPGMLVTLSGDNNATKGYAFIVRYAATTGILILSIQGWSGAVIHGPILRVTVSVNGAIASHTGPLSAAKGGTDTGTLEGLYLNYSFISPEIFSERIVDDFLEYMDSSVPYPYQLSYQSASGTCYSYPKPGQVSSFNPENRAGFLALEVSTSSDTIVLKRGSAHRNILSDTAAVCGATHVFDFMLPVLSNGTDHYEFRIGLSANGSNPDVVGDYGGVVISYRHDINAGDFRVYY